LDYKERLKPQGAAPKGGFIVRFETARTNARPDINLFQDQMLFLKLAMELSGNSHFTATNQASATARARPF
jgi:hypothetical protein